MWQRLHNPREKPIKVHLWGRKGDCYTRETNRAKVVGLGGKMNIEITAEYNGVRFPVVVGQEYEFKYKNVWLKGRLLRISINEYSVSFYDFKILHGEISVTDIRPIQKEEARDLTHKEIAMNLVGKGVFGSFAKDSWETSWRTDLDICIRRFCFFADLDEPIEKWHKLDTDLLKLIKERE